MRPRQNGRHFPDDISKCIFLNENVWILIKISLKFVPKGRISNIPTLVQIIMAWRRPGDKPLSEPMMASLLTHLCVTRPQWVKGLFIDRRKTNVYFDRYVCFVSGRVRPPSSWWWTPSLNIDESISVSSKNGQITSPTSHQSINLASN